MTRLISLSLALAVASVAAPVHAAEPSVAVDVDVSALPQTDITERLKANLEGRQARILEDGGFEVADDANTKIRVIVSRYGDLGIHYRFTVALLEGDNKTPKIERTLSCELCQDSELVTKVGEEVARISGRLLYEPEDPPNEQPADPEVEGPPQDPHPEPVAVRRIGGAGWAGIASAAVGLGVGIGGAVILARPPTRELTVGDDSMETLTKPRRLGSTLVFVGTGVLVTGVVLFAVDQTALLERRRRRSRPVSIAPTFSPAGIGLVWSGRF